MGPMEIILVNAPITTFQQSLTHSVLCSCYFNLTKQLKHPLSFSDPEILWVPSVGHESERISLTQVGKLA